VVGFLTLNYTCPIDCGGFDRGYIGIICPVTLQYADNLDAYAPAVCGATNAC